MNAAVVAQASSLCVPSADKKTETHRPEACATTRLDAVKVVERAKLMGVPAIQIGKVGGDKLTVKTASGEFFAPLTELHDAWWHSIARAMA